MAGPDAMWINEQELQQYDRQEVMREFDIQATDPARQRVLIEPRRNGTTARQLLSAMRAGTSFGARQSPLHHRFRDSELGYHLARMPEQSVISWVVKGRFTYVAVKVHDKWYTTATDDNPYFDNIMSNARLGERLINNDCSELGRMSGVEYI